MPDKAAAVVVLDLDETVLRRTALGRAAVYLPGLRLFPGGLSTTGKLLPGVSGTLSSFLGLGISAMAVTARWGGLAHGNTRAWMNDAGMQHVPLSCAPVPLATSEATAAWKAGEVAALTAGKRLLAGVGDKPSDLAAYAANRAELVIGVVHRDTCPSEPVALRAAALCRRADALAASPNTSCQIVVVAELDGAVPRELRGSAAQVVSVAPGLAWVEIERLVRERL